MREAFSLLKRSRCAITPQALAAAEAVSGERHLRVAPVLLLLGQVYCRTGRVTVAEGLYREACKRLGLDPGPFARSGAGAGGGGVRGSAQSVEAREVHPSLAAFAAWRHGQLLTVLPRRGAEASAWLELGGALHDAAPLARPRSAMVAALGAPDALSGKGEAGRGVLLDLTLRRLLPVRA